MKIQLLITTLVVGSYLIKSAAKIIGGTLMSIPILIADGVHGLFDIAEHGFLVAGGYYARKQNREKYPIDRQPLIDLLGLIIYTGLMFFGVTIFIESIKMAIGSMVLIELIQEFRFNWLITTEQFIPTNQPHFLLLSSAIMFFSYLISEVVYRFEYKTATEHRIREMKADARELRSDGWLELGTGIGLFAGWILIRVLSDNFNGNQIHAMYLMVNSFVLLCLSVYLMVFAWPEFWENFNNLMNRALEKNKRLLLQDNLAKRLPMGCGIIEPLVCYHRGDQLFIKGHLSIESGMMNSADLIIRNAELMTKTFFFNSGLIIYPQFSPFFTISEKLIDYELERIIKDVLKISDLCPAGEAFKLLRKGNLDKSLDQAANNLHKDQRQKLLSVYVSAEVLYRKLGAEDEKTKKALQSIIETLKGEMEDEYRLFFTSWLLIYYSGLSSKDDTLKGEINNLRIKLVDDYTSNNSGSLNDYFLAEAFFALGFSWERCPDYNLKLTREYYRKSEYFYKRGGFRSEMDRLYNTWGHFETLTYSLGDAELHLNFVREIRELKQDLHGLTFTYGCLGDLYGRTGSFRQAKEYYNKDIELLKQLRIEHPLPGLYIKMADQLIKEGLLNNNLNLIKNAIDLCNDSADKLNNSFFACKGKTKGLLGLAALLKTEDEKSRMITDANESLYKAVAISPYEKAFLHRLKGRLAGFKGNFTEAQEELIKSRKLFENMKDPVHQTALGIQAITSALETHKWSLFDERYGFKSKPDESEALIALRTYISFGEEMLGTLPNSVNEMLTEYELAGGNMGKQSKALDRMIWFLEG